MSALLGSQAHEIQFRSILEDIFRFRCLHFVKAKLTCVPWLFAPFRDPFLVNLSYELRVTSYELRVRLSNCELEVKSIETASFELKFAS